MTIEDDKAEAAFENSIDPNIDRIADLEADNQRLKSTVHGKCIRIAELEAENEKLEDRNIELLDKIVWLKAEIRRVTKANQIAECGDDKSPITIQSCVFCDCIVADVRKHIQICTKHPMRELEAENKRLRRAIEDLNPDYYMGISLCECSSEYPIGSCLYCDMQGLKEALK